MWIFTSDCFLSIVADKDNLKGDRLLVRSRVKGAINKLFPDVEELYMTGSDYAYRAWVKRNEVSRVVQNYINALAYSNFKNSITDKDYSHACMGVWQEMFDYQEKSIGALDYDGDNFTALEETWADTSFGNYFQQPHKQGDRQIGGYYRRTPRGVKV